MTDTSPFLASAISAPSRAEPGPPPPNFHPVDGKVIRAWFGPQALNKEGTETSRAQKNGLVYEKKAIAALSALFQGWQTERGTWIGFRDGGKLMRLCQPDLFVHLGPKVVLLIEVKAHHSLLAWWQLRKLYEPVLKALYPKAKILVTEVTKSFSHDVPIPEKMEVFFETQRWMEWVGEERLDYAVLQMRV